MKTIEEILQSKGITENTKFHNYQYLYEAIKACCEEYAREYHEYMISDLVELANPYYKAKDVIIKKGILRWHAPKDDINN